MAKQKSKKKNPKTYVLDTNILLDDPYALENFDNCNIIIPYIVLEELDKQKDRDDATGANARIVARKFTSFISDGDFTNGINLENGSTLYIFTLTDLLALEQNSHPQETDSHIESVYEMDFGDRKKGDNLILEFMLRLKNTTAFQNAILVTRDMLLRCKSNVFSVSAEDYRKDAAIKKEQDVYSGRTGIVVPDYIYGELVDKINQNYSKHEKNEAVLIKDQEYFFDELGSDFIERFDIMPNQYVLFHCEGMEYDKIALRYDHERGGFCKLRVPQIKNYTPRTLEHQMAMDMLTNPKIALCSLTGISGCGKSLAALAAGFSQVNVAAMFKKATGGGQGPAKTREGQYDYIVVTKPVQAVGKDIGYLPGTKQEKMEPWIAPITDNLRVLLSQSGRKDIEIEQILKGYFDTGIIEIEAITYMRGRSIQNAFIIIDEAQNCSTHELKTILTRVGENSKIVLTGDLDQIDALHVNYYTSGLTNVIEKFKSKPIAAHLKLETGIRSPLATEAAKIL